MKTLKEQEHKFRRSVLKRAVADADGSATAAARALGVPLTWVYELLDGTDVAYTPRKSTDGPAQMAEQVLAQYGHWLRSHADDRQEPDRMVTKWLV
jgi:uncharacterized protein YggE